MKNFLIGLIIGIVLGGFGTYATIKEKTKKIATKQNAEKVVQASQEFGKALQDIL